MRTPPKIVWAQLLCLLLLTSQALAEGVCVVGGLTREATLSPGSKSEGRVTLVNNTGEPCQVRVYQTDYLFYADGRNLYGDPGSAPRSNARWVTFTPHQVVVPARDMAPVDYTIQVPQDDQLTGTYWSMLMVEPLETDGPGPPEAEEDKTKVGLRTVLRYGIQLVTHLGDAGTRDLRFHGQRLLVADGKRLLQLDAENVGEQWLNPVLWVEVHDEKGAAVSRFDARKTRLYPGCSACFQLDLTALAPGSYNALIVADNEDDNVFGAQCKLAIR